MFERLLNKSEEPSQPQIREYIGEDSYRRLCSLETALGQQYDLSRELRFPFGGSYGWGYKYSHKTAHLCYAFFEKDGFTVTTQIGDKQVPKMEEALTYITPKARELWANRYPCGEHGGWVHYRVTADEDLSDVIKFINVKKSPARDKN